MSADPYGADARAWPPSRALGDLKWSRHNLDGSFYREACFTSQQAAEKGLKAYLLAQGMPVMRTHSLVRLLRECVTLDPGFRGSLTACQTLDDYYAPTRYPDVGPFADFTLDRAEAALGLASGLVRFIRVKVQDKLGPEP
jgi:HEPN domain-containing protein